MTEQWRPPSVWGGCANRVFLTSLSLDREEMKSLQAALQKQLDEANERAEKQQATVRQCWPDHQHPVSPNQPSHLSHRPLSDRRSLPSSQLSRLLPSSLNWNSQQEKALCLFPSVQAKIKKTGQRHYSPRTRTYLAIHLSIYSDYLSIYSSLLPDTALVYDLTK